MLILVYLFRAYIMSNNKRAASIFTLSYFDNIVNRVFYLI